MKFKWKNKVKRTVQRVEKNKAGGNAIGNIYFFLI